MTRLALPLYLSLLLLALPAAAQAPAVSTRVVAPRGVSLATPVDGMVEAQHQAIVAAQVQGRVLEVRVDAGQRVGQGQLLARIDARESAEAIAAARANVAAAKATLERTQRLVAQKFMGAAVLDQAQADHDRAVAQLQATEVSGGHTQVLSPLAGVVAQRHVEAGELAAPGRALFTLYQPGGLRMVVHVAQSRLAEVRASRKALIELGQSAEANGAGRQIESAAITVLPTIDAETHTATVRIDLPPGIAGAVPGMAGRVRFLSGESLRLTVPRSAVVHRGEVAGIYVKDAEGRFRLRQLRLGEQLADGEVEVLAGLRSGETVALEPIKAALQARR